MAAEALSADEASRFSDRIHAGFIRVGSGATVLERLYTINVRKLSGSGKGNFRVAFVSASLADEEEIKAELLILYGSTPTVFTVAPSRLHFLVTGLGAIPPEIAHIGLRAIGFVPGKGSDVAGRVLVFDRALSSNEFDKLGIKDMVDARPADETYVVLTF